METPVLKDQRFAGGESLHSGSLPVLYLGRTLPLKAVYLSGLLPRPVFRDAADSRNVCCSQIKTTVTWLVDFHTLC